MASCVIFIIAVRIQEVLEMNYKLMKCGAEFLKKMAKAKPELERIFEENNCSVEKSAKGIGKVLSGIHD